MIAIQLGLEVVACSLADDAHALVTLHGTSRFDTSSPQHRFLDVTGDLMFTTHCPGGEWMYGADICVSPGARGRGIGRALYDARKAACRRLNCRAIVSGGLLAGYGRFAAEESTTGGTKEPLNPEAYVERVVAGELRDPTLSFQLHNGFEVLGVIKDYVEDPSCGGYAAAIVWWNPDFRSR